MATRSAILAGEGQETEIAFVALSGPMNKAARVMQDVTRLAFNGSAFRQVGYRGTPYSLEGIVDFQYAADADAFLANLQYTWQGTLVTVLDDHGIEHPNQMLLAVDSLGIRAIGSSAGGISGADPAVALTVRLTLMET